jgi:hypothetical protein
MPKFEVTRRAFLGTVAAASMASAADEGWTELFDGHSLEGWRPAEHKDSWTVRDGALVADGGRSHLFYAGPFHGADFKNFELEVQCKAQHLCNSGVYFHTRYQESNFPRKGFEVQIANSYVGDGSYRERKKGGSLYGIRNVYKQFVGDDEWFKLRIAVRGKNVQIHLNDLFVVDYVEPTPPVIPPSDMEPERFIDHGTFALQCHNQGSIAHFRSVRVRPLPDDTPTPPGPAPVADDVFKAIIADGRHNIPMVDFHTHLKEGLTLEQALAKSRRDGIMYGVAVNCGKGFPIENDAAASAFVASMKNQPCFVAMQAEGREWTQMFSDKAAGLFDYIFTDSMTWTDNHGKRMRLWIPEEVGTIADPQEFMDTLVDRAVGILEHEPIDIYANPTFLPAVIAKDYDKLWTPERMAKVIGAAAKNNVAIEINNRYKLPSSAFIRAAKAGGCKFSFGTNNTGPNDLGRCEYGLQMVDECRLVWQDFFTPGSWWPKAIERKPGVLKG